MILIEPEPFCSFFVFVFFVCFFFFSIGNTKPSAIDISTIFILYFVVNILTEL